MTFRKMLRRLVLFMIPLMAVLTAEGVLSLPVSASPPAFDAGISTLAITSVKPGMKGIARTVLQGREVVAFPLEILSVIERKGTPRHLILVRASGPLMERTGGIAAGMSGSPVFVEGKLVGAIGYGWDFSDHRLGLVTPIEDMASVWDWPERLPPFSRPLPQGITLFASEDKAPEENVSPNPEQEEPGENENSNDVDSTAEEHADREDAPLSFSFGAKDPILLEVTREETNVNRVLRERAAPLLADGLSPRATKSLEADLGTRILAMGTGSGGSDLPVEYDAHMTPGDAIGVLLAWGDITIGATGTLTAVGKDGRFLGFAHPFLNRGAVVFPVTRAWVHDVIPSLASPFKLGSPQAIVGTVTQDRPQAIGGRIGYFAPSVSFTVTVRDQETKGNVTKRFHVADDPFLVAKIAPAAMLGIVDDVWGRVGQGTAHVTVSISGGGLETGWTRANMFFSPEDLARDTVKEFSDLADIFSTNEFREVKPLGFQIDVELTQVPRVLFIEDVEIDPKEAAPGSDVTVTVKLRPYRRNPLTKTFTLRIPEGAQGTCDILVRGGGIAEPEQESILQGWRSIAAFEELLSELNAKESNNELVVELLAKVEGSSQDKSEEEEPKLLSEIKARRMKEGTLRLFKSNYYVEGLMRRVLHVRPENGATDSGQ
ncbi:SpoIVB peptidase S55 domain-containing protein [Aminiphilus sp.]|jgi:hypothetical protein|uniref:SpoIVB peptidase S55 domain-containing protein n=1 Tax=Aminiphilus sp. TaxID=1872488 RepID=UPI00262D1F27|nr:SpoIVB peptidase S55 domain-containing protein [Aminiphilus sp.]